MPGPLLRRQRAEVDAGVDRGELRHRAVGDQAEESVVWLDSHAGHEGYDSGEEEGGDGGIVWDDVGCVCCMVWGEERRMIVERKRPPFVRFLWALISSCESERYALLNGVLCAPGK